jgi:hypothetical protein
MKTATLNPGASKIPKWVEEIVQTTPVTDIHTHLYDPAFKELLLWGIDELLVYHYLVAEAFRYLDLPYERFWSLGKTQQADLIWDQLFLRHSPVSEACRGVLTTLQLMGLDVKKRDLPKLRKWFSGQTTEEHITLCMKLAGVEKIFMTNSPFDDLERPVWEKGFQRDDRFVAGLRIDPLLLAWPDTAPRLVEWGYRVQATYSTNKFFDEVRRFLADWSARISARYVMVSLPSDFEFPGKGMASELLAKAVLPHCREHGLPLAVMPGVRRAVNPQLRLAGDGVGLTNLSFLQNLCAGFPENKFMATVLARENQHELCVLARKFRNLHIFGCWWFTNVPHIIDEMTRMRLELLGLSFTPQHSDARVLDQIIYKWRHSRRVLAPALADKYIDLARTGWTVTRSEIERDVQDLFGGAFQRFCAS